MSDYDRFGGKTPGAFLAEWTFTENGTYKYPVYDGFQLDVEGKPIRGKMTLLPGTEVDRFGSEYGTFSPSCLTKFGNASTAIKLTFGSWRQIHLSSRFAL